MTAVGVAINELYVVIMVVMVVVTMEPLKH
jgi:hypothetical protein